MPASLYINGDGVAQSDNEAIKWYAKACQNGNRHDCAKYQETTKRQE